MARAVIPITITLAFALVAGCDRDDAIQVYQAPKDAPAAPALTKPTLVEVEGARMTLPAEWQRLPDQQMRVATFRAGETEVTITRFGSESFAQFLPNINRWRNQVGLEPLSDLNNATSEDGAVGKYRAKFFNFGGQTKKLRVAVVIDGPTVWYFKLLGPTGAVEKQLSSFDEFLRSVELTEQSGDQKPQ